MAGVVFSKLSGKNDSTFKAVEGLLTEIIKDVDTGKNKDDEVLNAIFNVKKSSKFGERAGGLTEFADFSFVNEGGEAIADEIQEGFGKLIEHKAVLKSFVTTKEMVDDNRLEDAKMAAANFVRSYKRTRLRYATEYLAAEGATFTYGGLTHDRTTGDGVALFATNHPGKRHGVATQSNVFTNDLGNDVHMLNRLANIGRNFKNESGNVLGYTFDTLIIPGNVPELEEIANRIIYTGLVVGSANNDINTQKGKWKLIVNHQWEAASGTKPYILMSSEANKELRGLVFFDRTPLDVMNEVDIKTRNLVWSGYGRFSVGSFNWRAVILGGAQSGTTLADL